MTDTPTAADVLSVLESITLLSYAHMKRYVACPGNYSVVTVAAHLEVIQRCRDLGLIMRQQQQQQQPVQSHGADRQSMN